MKKFIIGQVCPIDNAEEKVSKPGRWQDVFSGYLHKKAYLLLHYAVLIILLLCVVGASAQPLAPTKNQGLQIGDKVPDITITNIRNYTNTTARISDFKGKLLILDFWATWCGPCIEMLPKMDSLQRQFNDKIQVLSVTYQTESEVTPLLLKKRKGKTSIVPEVTSDQELHQLFPHRTLPHYVWIDGDGTVVAMTGYQDVTAKNIGAMLSTEKPKMAIKKELNLSYNNELFLFEQPITAFRSSLLGYSSFSTYIDGLPSNIFTRLGDKGFGSSASYTNVTIFDLMLLSNGDACSFERRRVVLDVKDRNKLTTTLKGDAVREWMKQNTYCYELFLPEKITLDYKLFYNRMREDMLRYFPHYAANIERRKLKCLALVRTHTNDKFISIGKLGDKSLREVNPEHYLAKNLQISHFIYPLSSYYLQNYPLLVVDDTGYTGKIDLEINANMSDVTSINKELEKYGLQFVEKELFTDVVVIRDR